MFVLFAYLLFLKTKKKVTREVQAPSRPLYRTHVVCRSALVLKSNQFATFRVCMFVNHNKNKKINKINTD